MTKLNKFFLLFLLSVFGCCYPQRTFAQPFDLQHAALNIEEADTTPSVYPYKLIVSNGSLTDNGNSTASLSTGRTSATTIIVASSTSKNGSMADYVCDGVSDETEINDAIQWNSSSEKRVVLLEGQYNIASPIYIKPGVILEGQGVSTILKLTASSSHNMFEYNSGAAGEVTAFIMRDIQAHGNSAGGATGRFIDTKTGTGEIKDVIFEDVLVWYFGTTDAAMRIDNPWGLRLERVIIEFISGDGIHVTGGISTRSFYMSKCKLGVNGDGVILDNVQQSTLIHNEASCGAAGDNTKYALKLINGADLNIVIGNVFRGTTTNVGGGISIDGTSDANIIVGNQFDAGGGTPSSVNGITVAAGSLKNDISFNTFSGGYDNYEISDSGTQTAIIDNQSTQAATQLSLFPYKVRLGSSLDVNGSTGVNLSANAGILTVAGIGNTNNENIKFDFETTPNIVGISSTTGANPSLTGNFTASGNITGNVLISTISDSGSAPMTVTSTTKVTNLNTDTVDGIDGTGYSLSTASAASNPADATTYYTGSLPAVALSATSARQRIYIPKTGTVKRIDVLFAIGGTLGSTETSTINFRLNDTTDTVISSSVINNAGATTVSNAALSIAVAAGDYFELKWVTPTWTTNPTTMYVASIVYIE